MSLGEIRDRFLGSIFRSSAQETGMIEIWAVVISNLVPLLYHLCVDRIEIELLLFNLLPNILFFFVRVLYACQLIVYLIKLVFTHVFKYLSLKLTSRKNELTTELCETCEGYTLRVFSKSVVSCRYLPLALSLYN